MSWLLSVAGPRSGRATASRSEPGQASRATEANRTVGGSFTTGDSRASERMSSTIVSTRSRARPAAGPVPASAVRSTCPRRTWTGLRRSWARTVANVWIRSCWRRIRRSRSRVAVTSERIQTTYCSPSHGSTVAADSTRSRSSPSREVHRTSTAETVPSETTCSHSSSKADRSDSETQGGYSAPTASRAVQPNRSSAASFQTRAVGTAHSAAASAPVAPVAATNSLRDSPVLRALCPFQLLGQLFTYVCLSV